MKPQSQNVRLIQYTTPYVIFHIFSPMVDVFPHSRSLSDCSFKESDTVVCSQTPLWDAHIAEG